MSYSDRSESEDALDDSRTSAQQTLTEDVRTHLYTTLKEKGIIDNLKSHIRQRLITELSANKGISRVRRHGSDSRDASDDQRLVEKAANSLVADYLKRSDYEYTLSVFVPETGLSSDKVFTAKELLSLLHLSPQSDIYKKMEKLLKIPGKSFLWCFLQSVAEHWSKDFQDTPIQTDKSLPVASMRDKMSRIDRDYDNLRQQQEDKSKQLVEERLLNYQSDLDRRMKQQLQVEIDRFKWDELSKIRKEERDKLLKEFETKRKELEAEYRTRSSGCNERERQTQESLQRQQEVFDRESYLRRQSFLEEIESLRAREGALKREQESWERERKLLEDKYRSMEDEFLQRQHSLKEAELSFQSRIQQEVSKIKLEEESKYLIKWKEVEILDARCKEETRLLEREKEASRKLRNNLLEKQALFDEMGVSDYPAVKQENIGFRQDLDALRVRLVEVQQTLDTERMSWENKKGEPTPEEARLKQECECVQENLRVGQRAWEQEKQTLEKSVMEEEKKYRELLWRYEDQEKNLKEVCEEVDHLRRQLCQSEQELFRRPQGYTPRTPGRPSISTTPLHQSFSSYHHYGGGPAAGGAGAPLESARSFATSLRTPRGKADTTARDMDDLASDDDGGWDSVVHETKMRLENLDQETENLQEAYRNFQFRQANPYLAGSDGPPVNLAGGPLPGWSSGSFYQAGRPGQESMEIPHDAPQGPYITHIPTPQQSVGALSYPPPGQHMDLRTGGERPYPPPDNVNSVGGFHTPSGQHMDLRTGGELPYPPADNVNSVSGFHPPPGQHMDLRTGGELPYPPPDNVNSVGGFHPSPGQHMDLRTGGELPYPPPDNVNSVGGFHPPPRQPMQSDVDIMEGISAPGFRNASDLQPVDNFAGVGGFYAPPLHPMDTGPGDPGFRNTCDLPPPENSGAVFASSVQPVDSHNLNFGIPDLPRHYLGNETLLHASDATDSRPPLPSASVVTFNLSSVATPPHAAVTLPPGHYHPQQQQLVLPTPQGPAGGQESHLTDDATTSRDIGPTEGHLGPREPAFPSLDDTWKSHQELVMQSSDEHLNLDGGNYHLSGGMPEEVVDQSAGPKAAEEDQDIDLVMRKYMEKVKAQRELEAKQQSSATVAAKKEKDFSSSDDEHISVEKDEGNSESSRQDESNSASFW